MILGMSLSTFVQVHTIISIVAIVAGIIVMFGMLKSTRPGGLTALFLILTILTSGTGFLIPPLLTDKWLLRYEFMESAGDRWWPIFGATYMITAVKRVSGMRLVGPKWAKKPALAPGLAPVATPNSHAAIERNIQQK